jgi:hypothetical protein
MESKASALTAGAFVFFKDGRCINRVFTPDEELVMAASYLPPASFAGGRTYKRSTSTNSLGLVNACKVSAINSDQRFARCANLALIFSASAKEAT